MGMSAPSRHLSIGVPAGFEEVKDEDGRSRQVCKSCGFKNYKNPKVVVGSVPTYRDSQGNESILLVRRSIWPRQGYWTIPAGYMELEETAEAGAAREAREEANAEVQIGSLLAVYTVPRISIVQLFYRSTLPTPEFSCGTESQEVRLFKKAEIPWGELAFPTVNWALYNRIFTDEKTPGQVYANPATPGGNTDVWYNPVSGEISSKPNWRDGELNA